MKKNSNDKAQISNAKPIPDQANFFKYENNKPNPTLTSKTYQRLQAFHGQMH